MMRRLDRDGIARFLEEQDRGGRKTALVLELNDRRVDWDSLCDVPSPENPSVDVGQKWSTRCGLPGGRALHVLGRDATVVIHVDKHDPAHRTVRHIAEETNAVGGTVVGLGIGLIAAACGVPPKVALMAGGALGATIGGFSPVHMDVWQFEGLDGLGRFCFSRLDGVTQQQLLARA